MALLSGGLDAAENPFIKVFLKDAKQLSFRADNDKPLLLQGLNSANREKNVDSLRLNLDNRTIKIVINGSSTSRLKLPLSKNLRIRTRDPRGVWFQQRRYSGDLLITENNGTLRVVNQLPIEKYLKSVVGSEMPKSWPIEALKAQAVAARTYALNQLNKNKGFDIHPTIKNQVYLGIESETRGVVKAVDLTRSLVITHKGNLIDAVFHSSSGGRTEDSGSVWKRQKPYLISVVDYDQASPSYNWTKEYSNSSLKLIFPETGGLNAIRITKISNSKRILEALIYGPKGKVKLSGNQLRQRLDLKSTLVQFEIVPNKLLANSEMAVESKSKEKKMKVKYTKEGIPYPLPPIYDSSSKYPFKLPKITESYSLVANGNGSGHGVGMSQWGAKGMAKKGFSYKKILKHYYKDIKIRPF